jgi:hypothetical protein
MASQLNLKIFGLDVPHVIKLTENPSSNDDRTQIVVSNNSEGILQVYFRLHELLRILYHHNVTTKKTAESSHLAKTASEALKFEFHSFKFNRIFPVTTLEQTRAAISFIAARPKGKQPPATILQNFYRIFDTLQSDNEEAIRALIYDPTESLMQQDPVAHDDDNMEDEPVDCEDINMSTQPVLQVCTFPSESLANVKDAAVGDRVGGRLWPESVVRDSCCCSQGWLLLTPI